MDAIDRLSYTVHPGEGPYAILIPGTLGTRSNWAPNVAALAKVCRPVVTELWGHGLTPAPKDRGAYELGAYVDAIDHIRRELGAEDWFVIGQSFGGALGAHLALAHPETVRGLVLTNDVMFAGDRNDQSALRAFLDSWGAKFRQPDGREALRNYPAGPVRAGHTKGLDANIRAAMIAEFDEIDPLALADFYELTLPYLGARDRLAEIAVPVLVVAGVHERRFGPISAHMALTIPNIEVVEVNAGHVVNSEAWRTFNVFVTAFLRRHQ